MQFMDEMIEVKKGLRQVVYEHPLLEQVSGETYGVMIYQEQVQAAAKLLAGYTLGGADLLRRAMGKKDPAKMAKEKAHFVEGCWKTNQIDEKTATAIFDKIEKSAKFPVGPTAESPGPILLSVAITDVNVVVKS